MKLWKRAAAAVKDHKSLIAVGFSGRNANLEAAIIHATSHDDSSVDYANAQRVYKWIRASPNLNNLETLTHALSHRVTHTRSWVVALKSLMLLHGVLCCKLPSVIGVLRRLPFDLSGFSDGHSCLSKTWGFNIFVRAYFAFLHHHSSFLFDQIHRRKKSDSVAHELDRIQRLQSLLDLLLQIRPIAENMRKTLILEAMSCTVIESIDIYGRICSAVIKTLPVSGKTEPTATLKIINKAKSQREDLAVYLELCNGLGVSSGLDILQFVSIPKEEVEAILKTIEEKPKKKNEEMIEEEVEEEDNKALVVFESSKLETIITDKWEIFQDDFCFNRENQNHPTLMGSNQPVYSNQTMPDLITF